MRAWLLLALTLPWASEALAATRGIKKDIAIVERRLAREQQDRQTISQVSTQWPRDVRGRQKIDDIEQWAYTPELEQHVQALLRQARDPDAARARAALAEAIEAMDVADQRAMDIALYWNRGSMINWLDRWKYFALTNEISLEITDPKLLAADREMRAYLDVGDFQHARNASERIEGYLQSVMHDASLKLVEARKPTTLRYRPRTLPCSGGAAGQSPEARLTVAASPEDYYPELSRRLEEQGDIVVTAHVAPSGCPGEFAIVVSSGYPRLDDAALRVAEASRYSSAAEQGKAVDGYVTFRVRFLIKNY